MSLGNKISILCFALISNSIIAQNIIQKHYRFAGISGTNTQEKAGCIFKLSTGNLIVGGNYSSGVAKNYLFKCNSNLDSLQFNDITGPTIGEPVKLFLNNSGKLNVVHVPAYGKISISEIDTTTLQISNTNTVNHNNGLNYNMRAHLQLSNNAHVVSYAQNGDDACKLDCFNAGSTTNIFTKIYASNGVDIRSIIEDNNSIIVAGYKKNSNARYDFYISKIDINTGADIWSSIAIRDMYFRDPAIGLTKSGNNYLVCGSVASNSSIVPAIVVFDNNGDSINSYKVISHKNKEINTGYFTSFFKYNNSIFVKGHIQTDVTTPANNSVNSGEMAVGSIANNGDIISTIGFNDYPFYNYDNFGNYDGTYSYASDAISLSDSTIVVIGNGPFQKSGETVLRNDSYMVRFNSLTLSLDEMNQEKNSISLFPNPANNNISIKENFLSEITINDILGKIVLNYSIVNGNNKNEKMINVSNLPAGVYILKSGTMSTKFIKL